MNYAETAAGILKNIGGKENISHLEHCSTRLRFTLADSGKVKLDELKKVPGVMGVVMTGQCQVVIGNRVIEVYDEVCRLADNPGGGSVEPEKKAKVKRKPGAVFLDFIVGVFQPLIPAIAGAGILKSLLLLIVMFGWLSKDSTGYRVFNAIADAAFYFLPLLVADTCATKLKCNRYVAISTVGILLLPAMLSLIGENIVLFRLPVSNISYAYQVFPAILSVLFLAGVERLFNKISPKPIRVFFVPLMTFVIVAPITLVALGPLGYYVGEWFTKIIFFLFDRFGWFAVTLLAAALPFMIATGMHKAFVPYAVSSITTAGKELLYLPASLAHNISESGACFGVAIRTKDSDLRSTAFSAGISALFGITEPALYGVTIQNKRALASVILGAVAGGAYIGITGVEAYAAVGPGIASISMYVSETLPRNILHALIGGGISLVVSIVAALLLWRNPAPEISGATGAEEEKKAEACTVASPADGEIIPLSEVKDEVFSQGILGDGVAVVPDNGEIYAPADGEIASVFDTRHALTLRTDAGAEILIHCGLDTVKLNGKGFDTLVHAGERVKEGQLLMHFDVAAVSRQGYSTVTPVVVVNADRYRITPPEGAKRVRHGDALMMLEPLEEGGEATESVGKETNA